MSTFGKAFSRELGKNTGKYVSNKVFGTSGWATPRRHIIDIEDKRRAAEERKAEREQNRAIREAEREERRAAAEERRRQREIEKQEYQEGVELRRLQREIARKEKEEEREHKAWLKEQERIAKEEEKQANFDEVEDFENYVESIQSVHEVSIEKIDWESLIDMKKFKDFLKEQYEYESFVSSLTNTSEDEEKEALTNEPVNEQIENIDFHINLIGEKELLAALYGKLENGKIVAELENIPEERPNYVLDVLTKNVTNEIQEYLDQKSKLSQKYFKKKDDNYTSIYNNELEKYTLINKELITHKEELNSNKRKIFYYEELLATLESKNKILAFLSSSSKKIEEAKNQIERLSHRMERLKEEIALFENDLEMIQPRLEKLEELKLLENSIIDRRDQISKINDLNDFLDRVWKKSYSI